MFLTAKYYIWKDNDKIGKAIKKVVPINLPINELSYKAMYWRKANMIHNWFVENVQDDDDCKPYYVSSEQLHELYDLVCKVLDDHSKAKELLPTKGGFFFGGIGYDDYYFVCLEYTKTTLHKLFKMNLSDCSFEYSSSW